MAVAVFASASASVSVAGRGPIDSVPAPDAMDGLKPSSPQALGRKRYTRWMNHRVLCLFIVALVLWCAASTGAEDAAERSFLWRVTEGERTVHLLGSIHFMKGDAYPLGQVIEDAYTGSGLLVFETDMDGLDRAAIQLMTAGVLETGRTLEDVVGPDLYRQVTERFEAMGMNAAGFDGMKPWMVALSLTSFELMRAGYLGSQGIDAHFSERAAADGKPCRGLETPEFQVSLFADLSESEGKEFLAYTLADLETVIPLVDEVVAAWRAGDVAGLEGLLADGFEEHPELFAKMVTQRNLRWLPEVEALLDGDVDTMVVVGSLHLVGEQGLAELLRAKGYEVEQR